MTRGAVDSAAEILARLDRIPVWPHPWRVLAVVGAGFFFSFFDVVNIGFALPVITRQFDLSSQSASWAITSGLIGYILGSFLDSRIADRFGRRPSLFLSVSAFSLGSILSATSQSLEWLIVWRLLAGMGIGAEIALVTTYMAEVTPAPVRGRFTGWSIAAGFLGFAAVPFVALLLVPNYAWGWRALFVAGGLGGILILFMRRNLPDSPRWLLDQGRIEEAAAAVAEAERVATRRLGRPLPAPEPAMHTPSQAAGLSALFQPPYALRLVLIASVWFLYYVGNYAWLTLAPELLEKAGLELSRDIASLSVTGIGFVAGAVAAVLLSDRLERRLTAAGVAGIWAIALCIIGRFPSTGVVMGVGFLASFTIGLIIPILYTYTGENFPTRFRATAVALSDGFGHLGGAFCGQIVFAIYGVFGFGGAFAGMALTGLLAGILLLFGTNSSGRSLDRI
jgi:putative MFS transporter